MKLYRIFLAIGGKSTPGEKTNMWLRNIYDSLIGMGHDVYLLDIDEFAEKNGLGYMSPAAKERLSNQLPEIFLREHSTKPFDIFFSYLQNLQIIPSVLEKIKKHVYTINYSTNFHQFDLYKEIAKIVDCNIYISKIARYSFDELNAKSYWMPLAANPKFYKPSKHKNNDAVFVGSVYGPRPYFFWRILQYGINLQLYGPGWKEPEIFNNKDSASQLQVTLKSKIRLLVNSILSQATNYEITPKQIIKKTEPLTLEAELRIQYASINSTVLTILRRDYKEHLHPPLNENDYVKTLAESDMVINIQESRYNHDYYNHQVLFASNLRDFECTMCGTFLCTQYSDEIEELFEIGKELICYNNEHDLAEKIRFYNNHKSQKEKIALAGYQKSISHHTWEKRFIDFFDTIKI